MKKRPCKVRKVFFNEYLHWIGIYCKAKGKRPTNDGIPLFSQKATRYYSITGRSSSPPPGVSGSVGMSGISVDGGTDCFKTCCL